MHTQVVCSHIKRYVEFWLPYVKKGVMKVATVPEERQGVK